MNKNWKIVSGLALLSSAAGCGDGPSTKPDGGVENEAELRVISVEELGSTTNSLNAPVKKNGDNIGVGTE